LGFRNEYLSSYISSFGSVIPIELDAKEKEVDLIYKVLLEKYNELFNLIDEYNKARSLSPRQANMEAINQKDGEQKSKNTNSASSEASGDTTGDFLADTSNTLNESSNGTPNKSSVEIPNTSN
jgi:hypothetical protein